MQCTVTDLYLAYRHAKRSIFFERRGTGLIEFARFEEKLGANLRALSTKLEQGTWFDRLSIGTVWLTPKDAHATIQKDGYTRMGQAPGADSRRGLDVRVLLTPSVEFLICEVLFLWEFGALLDSMMGPESLGNRLELGSTFAKTQPRLFEYWPAKYQAFKTTPLFVARTLLGDNNGSCTVLSLDFSSFYDNIDARFLIKPEFVQEITDSAKTRRLAFDETAYRRAVASLLSAHVRFHRTISAILGIAVHRGIPIGSLTSRLIANLALVPFDRLVANHEQVRCYRRYVDDVLIVAQTQLPAGAQAIDHVRRWVPTSVRGDDYVLDSNALGRDGCVFRFQRKKLAVFDLFGLEGRDFIEGVESDLQRVASETRAFMDSEVVRGEALAALARLGDVSRGHRVLRESDRARLANLELSTSILALQRIALLLEPSEARRVIGEAVAPLVRMLADPVQWVERVELLQQVLKITLLAEDWASAMTLVSHTEIAWGDVAALRATVSRIFWNGRDVTRHAAFVRLRNYLHRKRIEAIYGSLSLRGNIDIAGAAFSVGYEGRQLDLPSLFRGARVFASTDLRTLDREDDCVDAANRTDVDHRDLRDDLRLDSVLSERIEQIDRFLERCSSLGEHCWGNSSMALFVCTRPPAYFDVARRWLAECESKGFNIDIFDVLLEIVNAVRGSKYRDSIGEVVAERLVHLNLSEDPTEESATRLILGNLCVRQRWLEQATRRTPSAPAGQPARTFSRLSGLATVLSKAGLAARVRGKTGRRPPPSLLVLPELSLPRAWVRAVARHLVRTEALSLIAGLEYFHEKARPFVHNQAMAIFVGPYKSVATWLWTKGFPANIEQRMLATQGLAFPPVSRALRRTVVSSRFGNISVLICSEMIEARLVSELIGAELIVAPSWNQDTSSYDHLIQSVSLQTHSIVGIANNGDYSDCRAWAPYRERWRRDLCRLVQRKDDDVIWVDLPIRELRAVHYKGGEHGEENTWTWRPLPPGFTTENDDAS